MYVVRGGTVVWSYAIPDAQEFGDCTMLSNGNIVFSRKTGASEITPDKKIVWNDEAPPKTEVHSHAAPRRAGDSGKGRATALNRWEASL